MILALLGLSLFPIFVYRWSMRSYPNRRGLVTGIAIGLVISPLSFGLYMTYFIPFIGFIPGMIGLFLKLFHGVPGFKVATFLGFREPGIVVSGIEHIPIEIINGIIWGMVYGLIGLGIDIYRSFRKERASSS